MYITEKRKLQRPGRRTGDRATGASGAGAAEWVRQKLGFQPDALQERVLTSAEREGSDELHPAVGEIDGNGGEGGYQASTVAKSLTLVVSPSARQTGEFLRKAAGFVRRLGIRPKGDGDNEMSLLLPNRSRIVGVPGNEATVRGFSAVSLMLVDEAARVDDEMYLAMRPMLAVSTGRCG